MLSIEGDKMNAISRAIATTRRRNLDLMRIDSPDPAWKSGLAMALVDGVDRRRLPTVWDVLGPWGGA